MSELTTFNTIPLNTIPAYSKALDYSNPKPILIEVISLNLEEILKIHNLYQYKTNHIKGKTPNIETTLYQNERIIITSYINSSYVNFGTNETNLNFYRLILLKGLSLIKINNASSLIGMYYKDKDTNIEYRFEWTERFYTHTDNETYILACLSKKVNSSIDVFSNKIQTIDNNNNILTRGDYLHYLAEQYENQANYIIPEILPYEL